MNAATYDRLSNIITVITYTFSTIFFGVSTIREGFHFLSKIFTDLIESVILTLTNTDLARQHILYLDNDLHTFLKAILFFLVFFIVQHSIDKNGFGAMLAQLPKPVRWAAYYIIVGLIFFNSSEEVFFLYGTF
jgi:hypothetical protein